MVVTEKVPHLFFLVNGKREKFIMVFPYFCHFSYWFHLSDQLSQKYLENFRENIQISNLYDGITVPLAS